jgi:hypothetical protein
MMKEDEISDDSLKFCKKKLKEQPVKVAIIDNGIDHMQESLCRNIERGMSFVKAGGSTEVPYLPWFTAADPHGTQMAYLIQSMNPWCRLFPARIGVLQQDIDVDAAIKVNPLVYVCVVYSDQSLRPSNGLYARRWTSSP